MNIVLVNQGYPPEQTDGNARHNDCRRDDDGRAVVLDELLEVFHNGGPFRGS